MMVLLTSTELRRLSIILARERKENPALVFRIWETTIGRYNDARIRLRLSLDEADSDDVQTTCHDLTFIASRDFLELRGQPHIFSVVTGEDGLPEVIEV